MPLNRNRLEALIYSVPLMFLLILCHCLPLLDKMEEETRRKKIKPACREFCTRPLSGDVFYMVLLHCHPCFAVLRVTQG